MSGHWTDRTLTEPLGDWMQRIYAGCDWANFDKRLEECADAGEPLPVIAQTLFAIRELERADKFWTQP